MHTRYLSALLLATGITSSLVHAHTPYLLPTTFDPPHQGWVTLDAAFADHFFIPDVVFDGSDFQIMDIAGEWIQPATVHRLRTRAVIEHQLPERGTYRFSTGVRHGAVFRTYEVDGEQKSTRDPNESLPEGARLLNHFQAVTLAETYLTLGAPTDSALTPRNTGLELAPATHPNDVYDGEAFRVQLLFDGQPLGGQTLYLFGKDSGDDTPALTAETNTAGFAELAPLQAGTYLLRARYLGAAPADAPAPNYSFTYTLTLDVAEQ